MTKLLSALKWTAIVIVAAFLVVVIIRIPHAYNKIKTDEQVAKIHATKLTIDDVLGKNLPPDPGAEADKTVAGIDANKNGIRDDVELAIFREYPNSAKTRAVLLQYALALQMDATQPFINEQIATGVRMEQSRANDCVIKSLSGIKDYAEYLKVGDAMFAFIKNVQRNTQSRKEAENIFAKNVRSYSVPSEGICDIDYSKLPN